MISPRIPLISLALSTLITSRIHAKITPAAESSKTTTATTAKESYADFGALAFVPRALEKDPARSKELAFVKDCRDRLARKASRGYSARHFIERFKREFVIENCAQETRVAVEWLISNQIAEFVTDEDTALFKKLTDMKCSTPDIRLADGVAYHEICCKNINYGHVDFQVQEFLIKYLETGDKRANLLKSGPLMDELFRVITQPTKFPQNIRGSTKPREKAINLLESVPVEQRTYEINLALGKCYIDEAWLKRGGDWAANTTQEQFAGFDKYLRLAAESLLRAHKQNKRSLPVAQNLMTIAMADREITGESMDHWLSVCVDCDDFSPQIFQRYAYNNSARWCGDPEKTLRLYEKLRQIKNYDECHGIFAPYLLDSIIMDLPDEEARRMREKKAEDFITIANNYIDRANETGLEFICIDGGAYDFRGWAHKYTNEAGRHDLIEKIHAPRNQEAPKLNDYLAMTSAANESGSAKWMSENYRQNDYSQTQTRRIQGTPGSRLKTLTENLSKIKTKEARNCVQGLMDLEKAMRGFEDGKTVALPLTNFAWHPSSGYRRQTEQGLIGHTNSPEINHHGLTFLGELPSPYEVSIRVKVLHPGPFAYAKVGFVVGEYPWEPKNGSQYGRAFTVQIQKPVMQVWAPGPGAMSKVTASCGCKSDNKDIRLTLRMLPHGYTFSVNGKETITRRDDTMVNDGRLTLGNIPWFDGYGEYEYSEMTIRKLTPTDLSPQESGYMQAAPAKPAPSPKAVAKQ